MIGFAAAGHRPKRMSYFLTWRERIVLDAFAGAAPRPLDLAEAAALAWPKKGRRSATKGNSWVRNSLRKLLRLGLVEKVGRGSYRGTGRRPDEVIPPELAQVAA